MPRVLLAAAVCVLLAIRSGFAYTPGAPVSKKPSRGQLHNKNQLPSNPLEVPDEEPQEDPAAKPPMPEHRVPYTLNIVAQFPQHQTMHEDSRARQFTEAKLTAALEHFEDNIKHVEVHLLVSDNFHRETPGSGVHTELVDDGEEVIKKKEASPGHRVLAPYIFKATVSLKDGHKVVMSNPEKHAQPSWGEAVDHMTDVLKKSLRTEKEKTEVQRRKAARMALDAADDDDDTLRALDEVEEIAAERDAQDEAMYAALMGSAK